MAPSTVLTILSALGFWHKLNGLEDPTRHYLVTKMVAGIRNTRQTADVRLPITIPILQKMLDGLPSVIPLHYEQCMLASMFALAFHAVLRVGEFVPQSKKQAQRVLALSDITITKDRLGKREMLVSLRKFKHSAKQGPQSIRVNAQQSHRHCPVILTLKYLKWRGKAPGPLFLLQDRTLCTANKFRALLKEVLHFCGLNPSFYKGHSFRIGAATEAAARGCSDTQIRIMGRWQSDAFLKYIRLSASYF